MESLFGWFWLIVYIVVPPLLVYLIVEQVREAGPVPRGSGSLPVAAWVCLAAQGAAMVGIGGALFVFPESADAAWPWTLTPLTAQAIGAFLVGFGIAAGWALVEADIDRLHGPARAYATLGVLELAAVAIHSDDLTASGLGTAIYTAFWVTVLATGAYGLIARSGFRVVVGVDPDSSRRGSSTHGRNARRPRRAAAPRAVRWIISAARSPTTMISSIS